MRERTRLGRKVGYGIAIVVLLFVLSVLGAPATVDSPGGTLAKLRAENQLSQSQLGEIDPASETIKLATVGLRGVAVQFLWDRATHFKKVEDWTNLTATLEQLAKLQPNFVTFWKYQSWNLSYNVSVEFDDYNDRYYWVRRGIQFLQDGNEYNRDNPALLWELGWVLGQKIGRADEKIQYRRLFKADEEFHPEDRPPAQRDNWLVSKVAYAEAMSAVDEKGKDLGKKSPSIFYSSSPKSQMNYSEAIEDEGLFETAVAAWKRAGEEWSEFGNVPIQHSMGPILRFNEESFLQQRVDDLTAQLTGLLEGVEEMVARRGREQLSPQQAAALEVPVSERTNEEFEFAFQAERILDVTPQKIADAVIDERPELARDAKELAADIAEASQLLRYTNNYKDTIAYDYWKLRCEFEQTKSAVAARSLIYEAKRVLNEEADPFTAKELYEEAFQRWNEVFEQFPELKDVEGTTGDDVMSYIYTYNEVLEQIDEQISDDFPLWFIIEDFDVEQIFTIQIRERVQARLDAGEDSEQQAEPDETPADVPASEEPAAGDDPGSETAAVDAPAPEQEPAAGDSNAEAMEDPATTDEQAAEEASEPAGAAG